MRFIRFIALVSLVGACGETHSPSETDAGSGIRFDAARADAGFDAGFDAHIDRMGIGDECTGTTDCPGICITELPGGYCTATCETDEDCPESTACIGLGGGFSGCLVTCDPSATERECRMGYGCGASMFLPAPICLPGCTDDTDCPMGRSCDPTGGREGAGACIDPSAMIGDACVASSECPAGGSCFREETSGIPGGTCGGRGCDVETNTGCTGDAQCIPAGFRPLCLDGCTSDDDCTRAGLACVTSTTYPDRRYCGAGCTDDAQCSEGRTCHLGTGLCAPPFDPSELGLACSTAEGVCEGEACLREVDSGFPGSYCTSVGCDPAMPAMSGCPGDGVCVDGASGRGLCLDGCETDMDCTRPGYACRPSDLSDPMSPTACRPACTDDMQCANDGYVCNDGTGLCLAPFTGTIGAACASNAECPGGRCVTEATGGWSGGMCTFPGCRLVGTGPSETCPASSVCVDDGAGDPEIGVCAPSCTGMTCRDGYACTMGACRPDCTATSCTGGRTCDDASGLCSES
jgi:hypothetical protein